MVFRFWIALLLPLLSFANEEALFLRRIADFWEEGEYEIAKSQMEEFLDTFPESSYKSPLSAALGDLLLREKNYLAALNCYANIRSPELAASVFLNRMQCLYHLQWYATLADECEQRLQKEGLEEEQRLQTTYFLAIALYQQCLNAQEPEARFRLAQRAEPYFSTLLESDLSREAAESFAHLCCILKEYDKASQIYLDLGGDEMMFQAALIQAEYDKELAIQTFDELAQQGGEKAQDAAYNRLVLEFELGRYREILEKKEEILSSIPKDRIGMAHFFFGKSFFSLNQYFEALAELKTYLGKADAPPAALLLLLETAKELKDLVTFDAALLKFSQDFPADPELAKGHLSRAQLLKHLGRSEEAAREIASLLDRFPDFPLKVQALLEWAYLDFEAKAWPSCVARTRAFIEEYGSHELAPFAWRYLASATAEWAMSEPEKRKELSSILEEMLAKRDLFPYAEQLDWQFLLAKNNFDQKRTLEAKNLLESLLKEEAFAQKANASLLLALCYRDQDLPLFCSLAEQALESHADLIDLGALHASLFNAYLEQNDLSRAADHLFAAFENKGNVQRENLLWLIETFDGKPEKARQMASLLESFLPGEDPLFAEPFLCKLAKAYGELGKTEEQIALLESLLDTYRASPSLSWACEKEAELLLAEAYAAKGLEERALPLFEAVLASSANVRSKTSASASLQSARLQIEKGKREHLPPTAAEWTNIFAQLKDLVLQKAFQNEPLHLEAAIEYIELQEQLFPSQEKRLALWTKAKRDFEKSDDLLSQDYHKARPYFPQIEAIYQNYLDYIEAEILLAQAETEKELQAKAKDFLLQIIDHNVYPGLSERAKKRMAAIENQN